jgi:hypothetical protein
MKTLIKILLLVALVAGLATLSIASNTDDSTVTITFSEIAEIAVSGNPGTLTIAAPATPGDLPADQSDATTTMAWTSNVTSGTRKITGKLDSTFNGIELSATVAVANGCGTSAGKETLTTSDTDFVTGIGNCNTTTPGGTITFTAHVTSMVAPYTNTQKVVTWTLTDAP